MVCCLLQRVFDDDSGAAANSSLGRFLVGHLVGKNCFWPMAGLELAILFCMDVASGLHMLRIHDFHPPESFLSNVLVKVPNTSDVEERNQTIKHWKYTISTFFFRLSLGDWGWQAVTVNIAYIFMYISAVGIHMN